MKVTLTTALAACALAWGVAAFMPWAIMAAGGDNYRFAMPELAGALSWTLGPLAGLLGAYAVPAAWRAFVPGAEGLSPMRVCLGLMGGLGIATVIGELAFPSPMFGPAPFALTMLREALGVVGAWLGARAGAGYRNPSPVGRRARMAEALGVVVLWALLLPGWRAPGPVPFPGGSAPITARQAWAHQVFDWRYDAMVTQLSHFKPVTDAVGEVSAIAPIPGPNRATAGEGGETGEDTQGTFTLEVLGTKGRGVASVDFHTTGQPADFRPVAWKTSFRTVSGRFSVEGGKAIALTFPPDEGE